MKRLFCYLGILSTIIFIFLLVIYPIYCFFVGFSTTGDVSGKIISSWKYAMFVMVIGFISFKIDETINPTTTIKTSSNNMKSTFATGAVLGGIASMSIAHQMDKSHQRTMDMIRKNTTKENKENKDSNS